jgi:hypothetical protein
MTDLNGSDLPIVGQANVVINAQLSDVPPNDDAERKMQDEKNSTVDAYELAFTSVDSTIGVRSRQVSYFTNTEGIRERLGTAEEMYRKYQCLGVVQTPGRTGREGSDQGMRFNVIHSAGSTSTINTGSDVIHPNDLVVWEFPRVDAPIEYSPSWKKTLKRIGRKPAIIRPLRTGAGDQYRDCRAKGAILGRAINRAGKGQLLNIVLSLS